MKNEIITFEDGELRLDVQYSPEKETAWLNRQQMAQLFDRDVKTIGKHINNILKEELEDSTVANFATVQTEGERTIERTIEYYNLDMILSVGYRVNSKRGIAFRRWANSVLKQYIVQGYAINEKRLEALEKTVSIQTKMLASALNIEEQELLRAVSQYTDALVLLDKYDHQSLEKPKGSKPVYRITYDDCKKMVAKMEDSFRSSVFGHEKQKGKVEGIIAAVYQSAFGQDVYPSLEEKAANLLYFMIKDHPYDDGCKRIAASLFLEFLHRNGMLYKGNEKRISDGALVAITLMIAESRADEKEVMTTLVMNMLAM